MHNVHHAVKGQMHDMHQFLEAGESSRYTPPRATGARTEKSPPVRAGWEGRPGEKQRPQGEPGA